MLETLEDNLKKLWTHFPKNVGFVPKTCSFLIQSIVVIIGNQKSRKLKKGKTKKKGINDDCILLKEFFNQAEVTGR
jgi:hypothetical protein